MHAIWEKGGNPVEDAADVWSLGNWQDGSSASAEIRKEEEVVLQKG